MKLTIKDFMLSERRCVHLLRQERWKDGEVRCPYCNGDKVVPNGTRRKHYHIARELQRGISMNHISKELVGGLFPRVGLIVTSLPGD